MPCGDGLSAVEKTLILCGFQGFFYKYVPVFLAEKNVYKSFINNVKQKYKDNYLEQDIFA